MTTFKLGMVSTRPMLAAFVTAVLTVAAASSTLAADIDLNLRAVPSIVTVGDDVDVQLRFVSQGPGSQTWVTADVLLEWDPALSFTGYTNNPGAGISTSTTYGAIPANPQQRWWSAAVPFNSPSVAATGAGSLVVTFHFHADAAVEDAQIQVRSGDASSSTNVLDQTGTERTGELGADTVEIQPMGNLPGDVDGDGDADLADWQRVVDCLAGPEVSTPPPGCTATDFDRADQDDDNDVDLVDGATFTQVFTGPG